ncbi:3-keto-disaccharide hydrolase [Verrucomicrobiota bacterium sgz303538]
MKRLLIPLLALALPALAADSNDGWTPLFDGKSLDGWKANENQQTFSVKDGELVVKGDRAHLFYVGPVQNGDFKNFEFKADVKTMPKANSGVYFHTEFQPNGWPAKGYEIQVNNTHQDPKKTAGVYAIKDNYEAPAKDGEWFTLYIKVDGKHIITKVNDKVISDYTEEENVKRPKEFAGRLISHGTFAIQGHDPGSETHYRNIMVKPLQ